LSTPGLGIWFAVLVGSQRFAKITPKWKGKTMKIKLEKIPGFIFAGFLLLLSFVWLGSFLNLKCTIENKVPALRIELEKALAGEKASVESTLYTDTMIIKSDSAFRGESVWVDLNMTNTRKLLGFNAVIYYKNPQDTAVLRPVCYYQIEPCDTSVSSPLCTLGVMVKNQHTDRTPEDWYYWAWGSRAVHMHLDTISAAVAMDYFSPGQRIFPNTGSVMRLRFVVSPDAPLGKVVELGFSTRDEVGNTVPNWADTSGDVTYYPQKKEGSFTVRGGTQPPTNHCPAFATMPSQREVSEGATLTFDVTATDADTDTITLSMTPLDPAYHYSFSPIKGKGSVTQTFSFTPTFFQGPNTIYAIFKAKDDQGCSTMTTVSIQIIETAQDLLIASSEEGGVPGSSGRMVPFIITNSIPIYGFQFTLRWDYTKVDIDSFVRTDALTGFTMYTNLGDSSGKVTVLVFGLASQTIPAGMETVLYAAFSVDEHAPPGEVSLQLENAREATNPGDPSQLLGMIDGKFVIDMFGDANIDRLVDIADVVSVVAYILNRISFTSRQFMAADVVPNDTINVADLVGIINMILGRWSGPSPSPYLGPMATVKLDYEDLQAGTTGEVKVLADLEVPVAGVQIKVDYDPKQLSFEAPRLSDWSNKFIAEYKDDKQGKLTVLLYNLSNDPISTGEGKLLSLPVTVSPDAINQIKLGIDEIVLADQKAVEIPVDYGQTSVPKAFELSQNYPNPFNPTTTIKYSLSSVGDGSETLPTTLKIYNVLGEAVRTLVDEPRSPGIYYQVWDGKDDQGKEVASGIYFYRLKAGKFSETKKMVLLK
jgi:hypothetical protein